MTNPVAWWVDTPHTLTWVLHTPTVVDRKMLHLPFHRCFCHHNSNWVKILFSSHPISTKSIPTKHWYDTTTMLSVAIWWSAMELQQNEIFLEFDFAIEKSLVKWAPQWCENWCKNWPGARQGRGGEGGPLLDCFTASLHKPYCWLCKELLVASEKSGIFLSVKLANETLKLTQKHCICSHPQVYIQTSQACTWWPQLITYRRPTVPQSPG